MRIEPFIALAIVRADRAVRPASIGRLVTQNPWSLDNLMQRPHYPERG
jgi:hypothetical protein